ncbi:MAG TPA: glutathione S-transferase family protein [Pseudomonadales bacterium]|nr:glutathione S-transferase family protein [Pseudomonadales bacterium]
MKLYTAKSTPNHRRVAIFLAEKGIEVPTETVNLRGAQNLSDEFLAKNPFGRIPVLELDDGVFISESVAICRYFEGKQPEPRLFGDTAEEQAEVEMWNRRAEISFLMPVAAAFRNISGFFKDREEVVPEWGQVSARAAADTLPKFDARLAESQYLTDHGFSIADITLAITLEFAKRTEQTLPYDLPNITRWFDEMQARPSWSAD